MKKIYFLMLMLLVSVSGVMAQVSIKTCDAVTKHYYTMHCAAQSGHVGNWFINIQDGVLQGNPTAQSTEGTYLEFESTGVEGQWRIKDVASGRYLEVSGTTVSIVETPTMYWTTTVQSDGLRFLANGVSGQYLNNNGGLGIRGGTGGCSSWVLTESVMKVNNTLVSRSEELTTSATLTSGKFYVISGHDQRTENHHFLYDNAGNFATNASMTTGSTEASKFAWRLVKNGEKWSFQNAQSGKFITFEGTGNNSPVTMEDEAHYYNIYWNSETNNAGFTNDNSQGIDLAANGTSALTWVDETHVPGGSRAMRIYEAEITSELISSYTYTVSSNKAEGGVIYNETQYVAGSEIADLSAPIAVEDLQAITIEGLEAHISLNGYAISVYYLPTAADLTGLAVKSVGEKTQTIETGKWYTLTQVRNSASDTPAYNNNGSIYRAAADQTVPVVFAEGTEATEVAEYLIRFVPGDFEGSYYMQFGDGSFWGAKQAGNAKLKTYSDYADNYLIYGVDGTEGVGVSQTTDGTTFGRILDNDGADATVAYWSTGKVTTTGNNLWFIYPVELEAPAPEVEFTVAYDGDETITVTPKDPEATYFWGIANDAVMGIQSYTDVYEFFEGYLLPYFWEQDMCTGEITMTDTEYRGIWSYGMTEGLNYILVANGYWDPEANEGEGGAVRTGDIEVYEITYGEPTGVGTVLRSEATSKLTFNLQGQRLNKVQRGINIINNKKVLVK